MRVLTIVIGCSTLLASGIGCASDRASNPPPSYQELQQQELSAERDEYIRETRERLSELDTDVQHMKAKLEHEKQFVDADQRASWSQELFNLEQEEAQLEAQLQRAQTATPQEWQQMRGTIGTATDSLQAGLNKLRAEVSQALALNEKPQGQQAGSTPLAANSGLCPVSVSGAEADVEQEANRLLVTVRTDDQNSISELKRKARSMAKELDSYRPAQSAADNTSEESDSSTGAAKTTKKNDTPQTGRSEASKATSQPESDGEIQVKVSIEELNDGVKLVFTPTNGDVKTLRSRLEQDAEQLAKGRCEAPAKVSMSTDAK